MLAFYLISSGKLEMIQLFCLAGSSFTAAQMGKNLRSRAHACAAAGEVCMEKGFLAVNFAGRRPSLG